MLNYFLVTSLAQREKLKVKNPEKYDFDPEELLDKDCHCVLNLYKNESIIHEGVDKMETDSEKT